MGKITPRNTDFVEEVKPPLPEKHKSIGPFVRHYFKVYDKKRIAAEYRSMPPSTNSQRALAKKYGTNERSIRLWVKKYAPNINSIDGLIDTSLNRLIEDLEVALAGLKSLRDKAKDPIGPTKIEHSPQAPMPKFNFNEPLEP
jgi:hypothetical protein